MSYTELKSPIPKLKIVKRFKKDASFDVAVIHSDCLKLLKKVPSNSIKLIVTSPPYNIGKKYETRKKIDEYLDFYKILAPELYRILAEDGSLIWQVGNYVEHGEVIPLDSLFIPLFKNINFKLRNRIVWTFGHGLHASKRFSGRHETILWFSKSDNYFFNLDAVRVPQKYPNKKHFKGNKKGTLSGNPLGKNPGDVWDIPNVKAGHPEKTFHPCSFPIELVERFILSMSEVGDLVFDPFAGTGATALASVINMRKAVICDSDKDYCLKSIERLNELKKGIFISRKSGKDVFKPN